MLIVPIDLAEVKDWTATCVLRTTAATPPKYELPYLDRWRGISYPDSVKRIAKLVSTPQLASAVLVADATGVGRPVIEMLREALPDRIVFGITITGGSTVNPGAGPRDIRVPKKDLIAAAQLLLQTGRLAVARELPLADTLIQELVTFQVRISAALNEQFESGREGVNDDLVLALAMGCWLGEHLPGPITRPLVLNSEPATEPPPESRMDALASDWPELFGDG
jgi:hypothetical protein